jgi:hypothetical protein
LSAFRPGHVNRIESKRYFTANCLQSPPNPMLPFTI